MSDGVDCHEHVDERFLGGAGAGAGALIESRALSRRVADCRMRCTGTVGAVPGTTAAGCVCFETWDSRNRGEDDGHGQCWTGVVAWPLTRRGEVVVDLPCQVAVPLRRSWSGCNGKGPSIRPHYG